MHGLMDWWIARSLFPSRLGCVSEVLHFTVYVVAPAVPKHLAKVRQRGRGAQQLPSAGWVPLPRPGHAFVVMSRNWNAAMIAERLIPDDGPAEAVPGGEADHAVGHPRQVERAEFR